MSEMQVKDFLSKDNTTSLYKLLISTNELDNIIKKDKEQIITNLIATMKLKYKTLELSKINSQNINIVKKQFNELCIKDLQSFINTKNMKSNNNITHDRKLNRDFGLPKKTVTISDRPISGMGDQMFASAPKNSRDFGDTSNLSMNDRLQQLEQSRKTETTDTPVIPDFLKQTKVGRVEPSTSVNVTNKPLLGYNDTEESNFKSNSTNSSRKYNDSMSVQDRLAQLEEDRNTNNTTNTSNNTNIDSLFNQPIDSHKQFNPIESFENKSPQQNQPQYQPQNQPQNQQLNNSHEIINNLNQIITNLRIELGQNNKNNIKQLQLEINKVDALYKYSFNALDNIKSIKLISYYLPPPQYNIISDLYFNYTLDNNENKILIKKGYYTIQKIIDVLNNNNDLVFSIDEVELKINISSKENIQFKIIPNLFTQKLGFIDSSLENNVEQITATNLYDFRLPTKLYLYIINLQEHPIGILNFNGNSICDIQFKNLLSLDKLEIQFTTEDKIPYNFNGVSYNLSFQIDIINNI